MLSLLSIHVSIICLISLKIQDSYNFKIDTNPKYAVFGHSHPACAFDETLIKNFYNASASGERFFYTFIKMKKFIADNESVEVVFIEFDDIQISEASDTSIWDNINLDNRFDMYFPIMNLDENLLLLNKNPTRYARNFLSLPKQQIKRINNKRYFFDQFTDDPKETKDNSQTTKTADNASQAVDISPGFEPSEYNIKYLDKCIAHCKEQDVRVILIRSPIYKEKMNQFIEEKFQEIRKNRFSNLSFLDFKDVDLKDSDFLDYGHLNVKGARKFSLWFNRILSEGLLDQKDPEKFIKKHLQQ